MRYLDALGLETHFSRFGEHAAWDEAANAGAQGRDRTLAVLDRVALAREIERLRH